MARRLGPDDPSGARGQARTSAGVDASAGTRNLVALTDDGLAAT